MSGCRKSFRRTQVFTANIARMANVTRRILGSLMVVHVRIPSTTNAASPAIKRFTARTRFPNWARSAHVRKTHQSGAQGRIRTSVPRKEEQIYSLPALTTHPPVQICRPFRPRRFRLGRRVLRARKNSLQRMMPMETQVRNYPVAHLHHIWKCFPMECRWSKPLCRRAAPNTLRSRTARLINAGAGEGI